MTLPEKCRMLLELAKKAISPFYPHSYNGRAFQEAVNPTTVQEICEAYLDFESRFAYMTLHYQKRIQELEADLRHREELSEDLSFIEADTYGKNKDLMAALGQAVDQLKEDYKTSPLDGHGALIRKLEATLAKARKVGG